MMLLKQKVLSYIEEHKLFDKESRLLLGLSGGADSMALAYFLKSEGFHFIAAHCNFQLRGKDSLDDQKLVEDWCKNNDIQCVVKLFDTNTYAKSNRLSIEMAARKLRYDWFAKVLNEHNTEGIVVAHHLNDQIETVFLNMLRGTGIRGLKGMVPRNGNVVRPFLQIPQEEIERYVTENNIPFRTDATNTDTIFLRNAIRHKVVPELEHLSPSFIDTMSGNMSRIGGVWSFLEIHFNEMEEQLVERFHDITTIQLPNEKQSYIYLDFLNYLFSKENYSFPMTEIQKIIDGQVGKFVKYQNYVLTKERGYLSISEVSDIEISKVSINEVPYTVELGNYKFQFKYVKPEGKKSIPTTPDVVWLALSDNDLPLSLRVWEPGDTMRPFGMSGSKKIKKMLTDAQIPSTQRKNYLVLCVNNEIAWLPGIRPGRPFIVSGKEDKVLEVSVSYNESK